MQTYVCKHYNKLLSLIEHVVHQQTLLHKSFSVAAWKNTWHESMYYKAFTTTVFLCSQVQFLNKHYPEVNSANSSVKLMYAMINIMNEWCIYIALYSVLLHTQSTFTIMWGSLLNHHQCAASTWICSERGQSIIVMYVKRPSSERFFITTGLSALS